MTVANATQVHVQVRFFASLRESMDIDAIELKLDDASLAGVRSQLATLLDTAQREALNAPGVQVAVNQAIVQGEAALQPGDEVAFLPPVTGG